MEDNITEIQIFVSCPGDVSEEKKGVHEVCRKVNDRLSALGCSVRYLVKDWKDIIGVFGSRPQETINIKVSEYDIYLGIWWMRFGSKTGATNPNTGNEFGSGSQEEFVIAYERWKASQKPIIYLFFKKTGNISIENSEDADQLLQVLKFKKEQGPNGFVNDFETTHEFRENLILELVENALKICRIQKVELRNQILTVDLDEKIESYKSLIPLIPLEYIGRSISHYTSIRDKENRPSFEQKKENLADSILIQNKIILLGDAGSGKSTELRKLFFELSKRESSSIPIFKRLNSYTPQEGIDNFLPEFWKEIPEELLVVILDGLDEIPPEHFNTTIRQITSFSEKYAKARIIISCRTNFYELPVNDSPGTLTGFEPYFINDLRTSDIKEYYSVKENDGNAEAFIQEVFDHNLLDLGGKPFFLMLLADIYSREKQLSISRAQLYDLFILSRINLDENHYKDTFDIREKKHEIVVLLERVALSMEMLSRNFIAESDLKEIISNSEFKTLKYCTAFKKQDGQDATWQFEHNNIQEYLAAKALYRLPFEKVVQFIAFEPQYKKLIPSWVNTLTFLFSLLQPKDELFNKLLQWMLDNEKEVVVKFEREKIPERIRDQIFQGIFDYYKGYDVWLSSNKFRDKELAHFGQSKGNIQFIINQLKDKTASRTVRMNAFELVGYFKLDRKKEKEVQELLLKHINENSTDPHYIHAAISALQKLELASDKVVELLMVELGERKNQYIRASLYGLLLKSDSIEHYVNYLIEGYELIGDKNSVERENISLFDEEWKLRKCIQLIKSPAGIKQLITYVSDDNRFNHGHEAEKIVAKIVNNAVLAYGKDHSVFQSVLEWFVRSIRMLRTERADQILLFFDMTNTRQKAFDQLWQTKEDKERNKSIAIAKLATLTTLNFIITQYNNHDLKNDELKSIYYDLGWAQNENRELFEKLIEEQTSFKLEKPIPINYEKIRRDRIQEEFDLLFNSNSFLAEVIRIFDEEEQAELTYDELFEIRKENHKLIEMDERYSGAALRLLRDLTDNKKSIKKTTALLWFDNKAVVEGYLVYLIYDYLIHYKDLIVDSKQVEWISGWCDRNIATVDFKVAIKNDKEGRFTITTKAIYLWYFSRRFKVVVPHSVLLDMLSFDYYEDRDWAGIDYIVERLPKKDIDERIIENLKKGISDISVLKNHVKYAVENSLSEVYPYILKEIINQRRQDYNRDAILDIYFDATKDIKGIKSILNKSDTMIRWAIVKKLKSADQPTFLKSWLVKILRNDPSQEEQYKAAAALISYQNIEGLQHFVDLIKSTSDTNIDSQRIDCITEIKIKEALPFLMVLLEISYQREITIDRFHKLQFYVLSALHNVAMSSEKNFNAVKSALVNFMDHNMSKYKNVNYLLHNIEKMDEQYFMNRAQSYTIEQVKLKIRLIE